VSRTTGPLPQTGFPPARTCGIARPQPCASLHKFHVADAERYFQLIASESFVKHTLIWIPNRLGNLAISEIDLGITQTPEA